MTKNEFLAKLSTDLPGFEAQKQLMPPGRIDLTLEEIEAKKPLRAGVLVHIYQGRDDLQLLLMMRAPFESLHSGQISFPGGIKEEADADLLQTAVREAQEEVGLDPGTYEIVGRLSPLYIPPSNAYVEPAISFGDLPPRLRLEAHEVTLTFTVPMEELLSGQLEGQALVDTAQGSLNVPAYIYEGRVIWGATAMMIAELVALLR